MSIYEQLGDDGIRAIVAAFYKRVPSDDLLGPMYPADDWEGAEQRLRDFLVYRFGGPQHYIEERGHPRLRMRHLPFKIGVPERDRWLRLMSEAMEECETPSPAREEMWALFMQVADFMLNQPETS
ncbi:MAG: globin [Verrucomicrobiaceae bacterium]|nr:globin [Verrucomicrobiaceae bacterium]